MLVSNEVELKWNSKIKKHYTELGYEYTKMGDSFLVKTDDLTSGSNVRVLCKCDYCGNIYDVAWYSYVNLKKKENNKDCCGNPICTGKKAEESMLMYNGVKNCRDLDYVNKKIRETNLEKYGCENQFANQEIKDKIVKTNIEKYGIDSPMKTKEVQEKAKITCLKKYGYTSYGALYSSEHKKELSPCWKGGVEHHRVERSTIEYRTWRKDVFSRDLYTCQCCGDRSRKQHHVELHAHHILNWNDNETERYDVNNGVTLCDKCHFEFHSLYGKSNNTLEQYNEFLELKKKVC